MFLRPLFACSFLRIACFLAAAIIGGRGGVSNGQETFELVQMIDRAIDDLDVQKLPSPEATQRELLTSIAAADEFFQQKTGSQNYNAWMDFLEFGPLLDAIEAEDSIAKRGQAAVELAGRLVGPEVGLELQRLVAVRESLERYIASLRYGNPKRGLEQAEKQLLALAEIIAPEVIAPEVTVPEITTDDDQDAPPESNPGRTLRSLMDLSSEEVAQIESILASLAAANQATDLSRQLVHRFSSSNLRGYVDGRLITDGIMRPVDDPNAVNECILGTRIVGSSRVTGAVRGSLLPSTGHVAVLLRLDGNFSTSTRGYNGPVSLDTTGSGVVYAARQLAITEKGIIAGEPIATASLSTTINRINHPLRLVRRIASKKAAEVKPQAEVISRGKLQQRVLDGFRQQTDEAAKRSFPDLDAKLRPWLKRLDLPAPVRVIGSTTDSAFVRVNLQRAHGLAAPGEPPSLAMISTATSSGTYPGGYTAAIQIHESILNNMVMHLLAGETFTPEKLRTLTGAFGMNGNEAKPAPTRATDSLELEDQSTDSGEEDSDEPESFEVEFSSFRPVFFEARDQTIRIGLRGDRFAQGERDLNRRLEVAAVYRPVITTDGRMMLQRDEEIQLQFPGSRRLSITQTAIKANIEEGFEKLFPMTLLHRELQIPTTVNLPALAGRQARVIGLDAQNGWLSIILR